MSDYNVQLDFAGWPTGLSDVSKEWIVERVRTALAIRPMTLNDLVHWVRECRSEAMPADFAQWALLDAIFCAVERAARYVAEPHWTLHRKA